MERSATGAMLSVSVAVLLVRSGSVAEGGAAMVAVFVNGSDDDAVSDAASADVTADPVGRSTSSLIAEAPLECAHDAPPVAVQVQVTPLRTDGGRSVIPAPTMSD